MDELCDGDKLSSDISAEFQKWCIVDEKSISLNNNYILKLCGTNSNKIGFLSSDFACHVCSYDESKMTSIQKYQSEDIKPTDLKLSSLNDSLLYSSSSDGCIRLWDDRVGNKVVTLFQEDPNTKESTKPLLSLDISCNDRVLCGGSELTDNDAFMLFWDIRKNELMGAYWNSHTDDIVQTQFSKSDPNQLITGSSDGLINVFDIAELTEDDALLYSLNTECAVDKLCSMSQDVVACITDNVDVQLWNIQTADQIGTFTRENINTAIKRKFVDDCYVIDVFTSSQDNFILAGSYSDSGKCLRSVVFNKDKKKLKPHANLVGNKQIIRTSFFDSKNNILLTAGESGILTLWKKSSNVDVSPSKGNKRKMED